MFSSIVLVAAVTPAVPSISVFGIVIGAPLSLPMCARESLPGKGLGDIKTPVRPQTGACWENSRNNVDTQTITQNETISILFNFNETMPPMLWNRMDAQIVEGKVEYLTFTTRGLKSQADDAATLIAKFGKPATLSTIPLRNGLGSSFDALSLRWRLNSRVSATFVGWSQDRGQGVFGIGTTAGARSYLNTVSPPATPSIPL